MHASRTVGPLAAPCLAAGMALAAAGAGPAPWWHAGWEARVPISVAAQPGVLARRPMVLRWQDLYGEQAGGSPPALASLRLVAGGRLVPLQIDHRDTAGRFVAGGDLVLDPQDELVFVAAAAERTEYHLYFSRAPAPALTFPAGVRALEECGGQAHWTMSTAGLAVSVQGTGGADLTANTRENSGRGTVVALRWQGVLANWHAHNWSTVLNRSPFRTDPDNRWSAVTRLIDGPVRTLLSFRCADSVNPTADDGGVLRGEATRYVSMFAGVPLYDVEDVFRCADGTRGDWAGTYTDKFHAGREPDAADTLWDGSGGQPYILPLAERDISLTSFGRFKAAGGLLTAAPVVDGWYAWFDDREETGLAVFYAPAAAAACRFESGWDMWSHVNRVTFLYQGLKPGDTLRHRFRVVGLGAAAPDQVLREYRVWTGTGPGSISIGKVEHR